MILFFLSNVLDKVLPRFCDAESTPRRLLDDFFASKIAAQPLSAAQARNAETVFRRVKAALLKVRGVRNVILTGSFARGTSLAPLNDVDALLVLDPAWRSRDVFQVHKKVHAILKSIFPSAALRKQRHSVRIEFADVPLPCDIIPAFYREEMDDYWIADAETGNFLPTFNPITFKDKIAHQSPLWCGAVRTLKWWLVQHSRRMSNGEPRKPLKSFYVEWLCFDVDLSEAANDRGALYMLFKHFCNSLVEENNKMKKRQARRNTFGPSTSAPDPSMLSCLSFDPQKLILLVFDAQSRCAWAVAAERRGDDEEALRHWQMFWRLEHN